MLKTAAPSKREKRGVSGPVEGSSIFFPAPASEAEILQFKKLQQNFAPQFESVFPDIKAPKSVVIIPSLTLDQEILSKVDGIVHYEERLLCLLLLLRMPRTHVVYVTSVPIDPVIVDYYLHLLPGITPYHARNRLTLLSCYDSSRRSLTEKILERPRLIERIKESIPKGQLAHMACFNVTSLERTLAVQLQMPVYGCDPDYYDFGNKSNGRKIFKECGIPVLPGMEDLGTESDLVEALTELKQTYPDLQKAVIKMNEGFSGEGNAIFSYKGYHPSTTLAKWIARSLPQDLKMVAGDLSYDAFMEKFTEMGGIVEAFLEGKEKTSPSVQCRINPLGRCDLISTHDQELSGDYGQVFTGAYFPAHEDYSVEVGKMGLQVAENLKDKGVLGRFGIDFISVRNKDGWKHYAIEINLRKGGTTHTYIMLQYLTDGRYDAETGRYLTANQQPRYYFASDNLQHPSFKGLIPHDLIDIAMCNQLMYDGSSQEGVTFHLIGALSQYGKIGVVCIGSTREQAYQYFKQTRDVLNREGTVC